MTGITREYKYLDTKIIDNIERHDEGDYHQAKNRKKDTHPPYTIEQIGKVNK